MSVWVLKTKFGAPWQKLEPKVAPDEEQPKPTPEKRLGLSGY